MAARLSFTKRFKEARHARRYLMEQGYWPIHVSEDTTETWMPGQRDRYEGPAVGIAKVIGKRLRKPYVLVRLSNRHV